MSKHVTLSMWRTLPPALRTLAWPTLNLTDKLRLRDRSDLSPQLIGLEGWRVEVVTLDGQNRRFSVGMTDDWQPQHLEHGNTRFRNGRIAQFKYLKVTPLRFLAPVVPSTTWKK